MTFTDLSPRCWQMHVSGPQGIVAYAYSSNGVDWVCKSDKERRTLYGKKRATQWLKEYMK